MRGRVLVLGLHGGGERGHGLEVHAVELLVGLGVLQGDGDLSADGGEQRELLGAELVRVAEADDERPDDALLARERHHQEAAELVRRARERAQVVVGLGVGHLQALLVLHGPDGELVRGRRGHGQRLPPLKAARVVCPSYTRKTLAVSASSMARIMSARRRSSACGSGVCARVAPKALRLLISRASVWVFVGEPVDARRDLRGHGVERLREAADLVATLRRQLLVEVAVGDRGRGGGQAPQRLADRLGDDHADEHGDEQGGREGRDGDRVDLAERRRERSPAHGDLEQRDASRPACLRRATSWLV